MTQRPARLHRSGHWPTRLLLLLVLGICPVVGMANADVVLQTREQRPWTLPADLDRVAIPHPGVAAVVVRGGPAQASGGVVRRGSVLGMLRRRRAGGQAQADRRRHQHCPQRSRFHRLARVIGVSLQIARRRPPCLQSFAIRPESP